MMVYIPSWSEILIPRFKWKTKSYNILSSTRKLLFLTYSYDEISVGHNMIRVSWALNDFHIMVHQVEYSKILLMKDHLHEWEYMVVSLRISIKVEFSKALMNSRVV
jgi:hypothetical protein